MGKLHTHYDNLKVARLAPQEVIRAAYKALSQKYHPDKNSGDETAARIMAILNTAYATLSDPQRRREHDEWIVAEEWEIDWLLGTQDEPRQAPAAAPRRRHWTCWTGLAACLAIGWLAGALVPAPLPAWSQPQARGPAPAAAAAAAFAPAAARSAAPIDGAGQADLPVPDIKVLALSQVLLPGSAEDCRAAATSALAPNGEAWPQESGYVAGFMIGNKGHDMQLLIDNSKNASDVFVKLYDIERRANVRYVYVLAHDKLTVDELASGKYELRYQHMKAGGACDSAG